MKIQKELDETKIVLHKTIESVLERGEKIDSLVEKSDGLSAQSKLFYTHVSWALLLFCRRRYLLFAANHIPINTGKETKLLLRPHVNS